MKHTFRIAVVSLAFASICQLGWSAGYEFEGVGARAVSRGGAVIADSADWTAMYWNPGNISKATQNGKKDFGVEVFGGTAYAKDSNSLSGLVGPVFSNQTVNSSYILGAVGGAVPVTERLGLAFGVYTPILQGVTFKDTSSTTGMILSDTGRMGIVTGNLSAGYRVTDRLNVGAGLNVLYGKFKNSITIDNFLLAGNTIETKLEGDGMGLEGIFGINFDVSPKLSLGTVYRTGSDVSIRGRASSENTNPFLGSEASNFRFDLRHPPTWGLGSAWHANEKLTMTLDLNRTFWNRFSNSFLYDQPGTLLPNTANTFSWRDSWKLRLGTAYKLNPTNEVFGGYAYDWPALDKSSIDLSTVVDTNMNRLSFGYGHKWSDRLESVLGGLAAYGTRRENGVRYRLSGWQAMLELRYTI